MMSNSQGVSKVRGEECGSHLVAMDRNLKSSG